MRRVLITAVSAAFLFLAATPAFAGGWAVVSFADAPSQFTAGESHTLHYLVLQHGETPVEVDETAVVLRSVDSGEILTFEGRADGGPGRYVVEVSVPATGSWEWEVTQEPFEPQQLGTLPIVLAPSAGSSAIQVLRVLLPLATVAALVLLVLQLVELRRGTRRAQAAAARSQEG